MNILLTGSGGFIGQHLKEHLKDKYNLLTPCSWKLNLLNQADVDEYFNNHEIDMIIHLAAAGVRITPDATIEEVAKPNIEMFDNLAKHVSEKCKMIMLGSGAEYDKSKPIINVKESEFGKSIPQDPYGYSKYLISKKIEKQENILNLRVFGVYGVGESPTRVTSAIVNAKIKNEPVVLNQNVRFCFIWIEDLCKIVEYFIENPTKEKFINVTPNESIEIADMAKLIGAEVSLKNEGLNNEYTGDNTLLKSKIGDFEFYSYKTGLLNMYEVLKGQNNG